MMSFRFFHQLLFCSPHQCVDSWLGVNASCPSCRARCFDQSNDEGEEKSGEHEAQSSQELA